MCQLTFLNINNQVNASMLYMQLISNTLTSHQDGFGFYQQGGTIFKSKERPVDGIVLAHNVSKLITNTNPIMAHVRLAPFKLSVKDENTHPFETDKLILAHNGTLVAKKDAIPADKYKDKIDSETFLGELSEAYTGTNIVKALNATMNKFTGPFAFIIYSKLEDKFFIVRGKTKTLFLSKVVADTKSIGFIVNTERADLSKALRRLEIDTYLHTKVKLASTEPELLPEGSILVLKDGKLKNIGSIQENEPERAPVVVNSRFGFQESFYNGDSWKTTRHDYSASTPAQRNLANRMVFLGFSLEELDVLMVRAIGIPLVSAIDADFDTIYKYIIPKFEFYYSTTKEDMWRRIKAESQMPVLDIYTRYKLKFPYVLEKTSKLERTLTDLLIDKEVDALGERVC